jgi:hypothetical protein
MLSMFSVSHVMLVAVRSIIIRKMTVVISLVQLDIQEERTSIDRCLGGRKISPPLLVKNTPPPPNAPRSAKEPLQWAGV